MKTILGIFLIVCTCSCATILKGTKEKVYFNTEPANVAVYVDGNYLGQSPFYTKLKTKRNYVIDLVADSTHSERVYLDRKLNKGYFVLDILMATTFYLAPFAIIDGVSGAWYQFENPYIYRKLK